MKKPKPPRSSLSSGFAAALKSDWRTLARPQQLPPKDFSIWLFLAGRGSGKTWSHAHLTHELAAIGSVKRIALIGATNDSTRAVMVEGLSGILSCAAALDRPTFEPSKGQLVWPSGTIAQLFSADQPELLRGPEHDFAWCDELASWRRAEELWANLMMTMRAGAKPQVIISTTPRPTKLIKELVAREGQDGIVISRSTTYDNRQNLPPSFFSELVRKFEGSRTGRQELLAELLLDTPGSLWTAVNLEATRVSFAPPMQRIVIAIDPSGSGGEDADECGLIAAGLGQDGQGYIIADLSGRMSPIEWSRKAVDAYHVYKADRIVAEKNFGGDMVLSTIAAVDASVPTKAITSSRSKQLRAEPISTFFEQGRAHLVGSFPQLEDQLTSFTADFDRRTAGFSPDRVDALVFALTELMCNGAEGNYFRESLLLLERGEPFETPKYAESVLAVIAAPTKSAQDIAAVYLANKAYGESSGAGLVVIDWDLVTVDDRMFEIWLPTVYQRLADWATKCKAANFGIWGHGSSGLVAALLQHAQESGRTATDINDHATWGTAPLADRVAAASRHVLTGRRVKIAQGAYEKYANHRGFTRNHFMAAFKGFRVGEDLGPESEALLGALVSGALISLDDSDVVAQDFAKLASPGGNPLYGPH
jgi:phage terminase large subunit-like protein